MAEESVLIVDDDQSILEVLKLRLETEGYNVIPAGEVPAALKAANDGPFDLALVDLKLAGQDGIRLMQDLHRMNPDMPIIILTAYGTIESAVEAMKQGAYSYITKPFDHRDLLLQIKNGLEKSRLSREIQRLKDLVGERYGFENIVGKSEKMAEVLEQVSRAAETDSNVCIYGESGTGKELIAKSLHLLSSRKDKPFVAINCAAIPETLLESELFGYEKGAFTGAVGVKRGLLTRAHRGSIFLDEISEMSPTMQAKLLRVVQEKEFYPVGGERPVKVDIRIVAATNKNLEEEVTKGKFREDLFYRIHVIPIHLPPLRERKEDIPLLVDHFLRRFSKVMKKNIRGIATDALQKLLSYPWPGNVRELENTIEYAVAMSTQEVIGDELVLQSKKVENGKLKPFKEAKEDFEREYVAHLLALTSGNVSEAATLAGKYRADFYTLLRKYHIKPEDFKKA